MVNDKHSTGDVADTSRFVLSKVERAPPSASPFDLLRRLLVRHPHLQTQLTPSTSSPTPISSSGVESVRHLLLERPERFGVASTVQ
jgi:hypothetical protein